MCVALFLPKHHEPAPFLQWAVRIAHAANKSLLILIPTQNPKTGTVVFHSEADLRAAADVHVEGTILWVGSSDESERSAATSDDDQPPAVKAIVKELPGEETAQAVLNEIKSSSVATLIIARAKSVRSNSPDYAEERRLFRSAPCETIQVRIGDESDREGAILVPASGGSHTTRALQLGLNLAKQRNGSVTAMHVTPNVDEVAELVGQRRLRRILSRSRISEDTVTARTQVSDDLLAGIQAVRDEGCQLLILGVQYHSIVHRFLFSSTSERLLTTSEGPTVVVVRPPIPLISQFRRWAEHTVKQIVPQLDREKRVELVDRVESGSQWNFDFFTLVCLSTMIAALGLLRNSPAVVIGAMLIAPLMMPLLGIGLSLTHGNRVLFVGSCKALLLGFGLAVLISFFVGLFGCIGALTGCTFELTEEMRSRGKPTYTDLLIALVSGLAASYAIGRRNLLSALPGVAIATALLPPIATSVLASVMLRFDVALGACILFFTNVIAIIVGATIGLAAVGVRGEHRHGVFAKWVWRVAPWLVLFVLLIVAYFAFISSEGG